MHIPFRNKIVVVAIGLGFVEALAVCATRLGHDAAVLELDEAALGEAALGLLALAIVDVAVHFAECSDGFTLRLGRRGLLGIHSAFLGTQEIEYASHTFGTLQRRVFFIIVLVVIFFIVIFELGFSL